MARVSRPGPIQARRMPTAARRVRCSKRRGRAIAEALGWRHDVIFTSGASESIEIAAKRARSPGRAHRRDRACHRSARDGRRVEGHRGRCRWDRRRSSVGRSALAAALR